MYMFKEKKRKKEERRFPLEFPLPLPFKAARTTKAATAKKNVTILSLTSREEHAIFHPSHFLLPSSPCVPHNGYTVRLVTPRGVFLSSATLYTLQNKIFFTFSKFGDPHRSSLRRSTLLARIN